MNSLKDIPLLNEDQIFERRSTTWPFQPGMLMKVGFKPFGQQGIDLHGVIVSNIDHNEGGPPVSRIAVWNGFGMGGYSFYEVMANRVYAAPDEETAEIVLNVLNGLLTKLDDFITEEQLYILKTEDKK